MSKSSFVDQKKLQCEAKDLNPYLKLRSERTSSLTNAGYQLMGGQKSTEKFVPYSEVRKQVYGN